MVPATPKEWGDYKDVMEATGYKVTEAYAMKKKVTHRKLGRKILFHMPSVQRWLDANTNVIEEPAPAIKPMTRPRSAPLKFLG